MATFGTPLQAHPQATANRRADILLVVPPFQTCGRPALGVSQLKANLGRAGQSVNVLYLNLKFAERIGWEAYETISVSQYGALLGEFIFSGVLFERSEQDVRKYVERVLGNPAPDYFLPFFHEGMPVAEKLQRLMREANEYCRTDAVEEILAHDPWLVGFTSSFHQNCASLSMARDVKARRPNVITVMGGSNCEGDQGEELLRQFPQIDYIGQGECDQSFVQLVEALRRGSRTPQIEGILVQGDGRVPLPPKLLTAEELDGLPHPDFRDYFDCIRTDAAAKHVTPALVMETSRGCWWGAKSHCTFCGLNGNSMAFRSKSAPRVLEEIIALVSQYRTRYIAVADNILDMKYFNTLLPELAKDPVADLFFETKANLNRAQVELLSRAGIHWIQPGIESLSDLSLRLMKKGSTKLQNIQLLKWCAEFRVDVNWNYLYGFPGESEEEVSKITEEVQSLHHLQPPLFATPVRWDRYSPYGMHPEQFGIGPITAAAPYSHVYPFSEESLARLAYFYDSEFYRRTKGSRGLHELKGMVATWSKAHFRSHLVAFPGRSCLHIVDTRSCARRRWHRLKGIERDVFEYCDQARTSAQIQKAFPSVDQGRIESILKSLVDNKLVLADEEKFLGLAIDARHGYSKSLIPRSGGTMRSQPRQQSLRRDLAFLLRVPPKRLVRAAWLRAKGSSNRMITSGLRRGIEAIVALNAGRSANSSQDAARGDNDGKS